MQQVTLRQFYCVNRNETSLCVIIDGKLKFPCSQPTICRNSHAAWVKFRLPAIICLIKKPELFYPSLPLLVECVFTLNFRKCSIIERLIFTEKQTKVSSFHWQTVQIWSWHNNEAIIWKWNYNVTNYRSHKRIIVLFIVSDLMAEGYDQTRGSTMKTQR